MIRDSNLPEGNPPQSKFLTKLPGDGSQKGCELNTYVFDSKRKEAKELSENIRTYYVISEYMYTHYVHITSVRYFIKM